MPEPDTGQLETPPDLQKFAQTIVDYFVSVENIEKMAKGTEPVLVKVVEIALGTIVGVMGTIGAEFAKAIVNAEEIADPAFRRLANVALKDITGVDAGIDNAGGGRAGRAGAARNIGAGILQALSGISGAGAGTGGTLAPSTKAAEDYLSFVVQMSLEGWLTGLMGEMMTLGAVENLGDLDDSLANALGLARTSRAVMRPFINTTVALPAQWAMNKAYRPELLGAGDAVRQFLRGRWTVEQLREELARQGFSDDRIEALINAQRKFLAVGELYEANRLGLLTFDEAIQQLRDQGFDEPTASLRLRLEIAREVLREEDALASALVNAYASYDIDEGEFERGLAESGIGDFLAARVRNVGKWRRRWNQKQLSEGDFEQAVKRGIRSHVEYRAFLRRRGYDEDAVATRELLLRDEIKHTQQAEEAKARQAEERDAEEAERKRKAAERAAEIAAEKAVTEPSRKDVMAAFVRGIVSEEFYRSFLVTEKYDGDSIAFLIELARQDRAKYVADVTRRAELEAADRGQALGIAQLERAVAGGHLSVAEFGGILRGRGYSAGDADLLVRLAQDRLDELEDARRRREEAEPRAAAKGLSIGQIEQAVLRGVTTLNEYDAWLLAAGFGNVDRGILVRLLGLRLDEYEAERARRPANEQQAAGRGLSLADAERAVLAGLLTFNEYATALTKAGFEPASVQTMVALLQLDKATRDAAAAARAEAETRGTDRGLSLSELGRAVRLGVLTLAQYRAALDALGYRGADADVIVETLVRELQAQRDDERRREELRAEADVKQLPIEGVERAVLAGWLTIADYAARLEAFGYDEADRGVLVALLQDERAEVDRQQETRVVAGAELESRSISLADFEAAVKSNVRSIDEYGAFLSANGFDQASRSTLIALLARELKNVERAQQLRDDITAAEDHREPALAESEGAVGFGNRTLREHFDAVVAAGFSESDAALLTLWLDQQLNAKKPKPPGGGNA